MALAGCGGEEPALQTADATVTPTGDLPCPVDRVLRDVCQQCHGSPTKSGAPFALITYADTQAVYMGQPVWKRMNNALQTGMMPMSPVTITDEEKATLLQWLGKGAPPAADGGACTP